jgi:hypothetical protein
MSGRALALLVLGSALTGGHGGSLVAAGRETTGAAPRLPMSTARVPSGSLVRAGLERHAQHRKTRRDLRLPWAATPPAPAMPGVPAYPAGEAIRG